MISTGTNKGPMGWKALVGALYSDIRIDFLRRSIKDANRKIYMILGNPRVHHSRPVKLWLPEHKDRIEVFYLPIDSAELDSNEMVNAELKPVATNLPTASTKLRLVKATTKRLSSVQRRPERNKSYFQHAPVRYAA